MTELDTEQLLAKAKEQRQQYANLETATLNTLRDIIEMIADLDRDIECLELILEKR